MTDEAVIVSVMENQRPVIMNSMCKCMTQCLGKFLRSSMNVSHQLFAPKLTKVSLQTLWDLCERNNSSLFSERLRRNQRPAEINYDCEPKNARTNNQFL